MVMFLVFAVVIAAILLRDKKLLDHSKRIEQILPIWKVEDNCLLSKSGDVTVAFKVELPEIFSLSYDDYEALHQCWLKAIRILPAGTILHKQDWFTKASYKADLTKDHGNFLKESSSRYFDERPCLDHSCYLMITLKPRNRKLSTSAISNLFRLKIVPSESVDQKLLAQLLVSVGQFQRILTDSGFISMTRLKDMDLLGTEKESGLLEKYLCLTTQSRVLKDIQFKPQFHIGENYCQVYSLADAEVLPEMCSPRTNYERYSTERTKFSVGFASHIGLLLPVNHIYNQFLIVEDTSKTIKRLEAKRLRLHSLSAYSRENAINSEATGAFLNEAVSHGRQPIKAHFNLHCWTDKEEELKEIRNLVASSLAQMDVTPRQEDYGAAQIWWAGLPGNEGDFPVNDTFETFAQQASCFLNMETAYRSSGSPFGIRLGDRLTGVPLHVDISDEPMRRGITTNRNKIVIGGSGSGKSMFMNHMLHSYVQQGAHCIVVDVGHSYEGLCKLLNGYYFTYTDHSPIRFNPFHIPPGEVLDTEKKESIKTLLVALWKQNDESFRRSEYVAISNALQSFYGFLSGAPDIFPCFDSFYEFLQNKFSDELKSDGVKDKDFDFHNFLYVLRPYYKGGEFDFLLNARENLDILRQPFVVFELDNLKDHPTLFSVVTLIIMENFISKMRKLKGVRKVIVIEEAWKAIARAGMAEFMKYLYKTVRKHFGEAITVTQEVDDVISSPIIKEAIINNADCKILFDMRKFQNKFEGIQAALGISEKGRDQVLSLNKSNDPNFKYREIYFELANQIMMVYRFEPSPEEYYAYSTEQSEKMKVQEYTERYGSIAKGLRALVSDLQRS